MTMINVQRLAHACIKTAGYEAALAHYTEVVGLQPSLTSAERTVLTTASGVETLVLERDPTAETAVVEFSLQTAPKMRLQKIRESLSEAGFEGELVENVTPGIPEAIRVVDPVGSTIYLYTDGEFGKGFGHTAGISPIKLGHIARFTTNFEKAVEFYVDVLGFRVSDRRSNVGAFLRCGPDHHTINLGSRPRDEFAHIAYELKDGAAIHAACDILRARGIKLDWGPSRHNIGHNFACYYYDPIGIRVELYTEMDQMKSEKLGYFEPRPWHDDLPQRPKVWPDSTSKNHWSD